MGKRVLITGGGSAIAWQVAIIWAKRGYSLFLIDKDEMKAQTTANDLKVRGAAQVWSMGADLTDVVRIEECYEKAKGALGQIDILLVAHGYLGDQQRAQSSCEEAAMIIKTNFSSAVAVMELAAKDMERRREGVIAVISSVAGDRGRKSNYVYGAAKGALAIWAAGMRHRLDRRGVKVITIKPGFVITPMTASIESKGRLWVMPEKVGQDIVRAIDRGKAEIYTPWWWRWIMVIIRLIPSKVFNKLEI